MVDSADDTFYYSCSQNAGCSGVHDLASTTTTLSAAAAVGATNVKLASVTGLVVGGTLTIDSTGANPETVTITTVGTSGAGGTGVSFTPALGVRARLRRDGRARTASPGTQSLGFGSRGSGLRCTTDAPLVQDPSNSATLLHRLQQPLAVDEPRGELDADRGARPADRPGAADDSTTNNPLYAGQFPSVSTIGVAKARPEHDLRGHRQRPALEDDRRSGPRGRSSRTRSRRHLRAG